MRRLQPVRFVGGAAVLTAALVVVVTEQEQRLANDRAYRAHLTRAVETLAGDAGRLFGVPPADADAEIRRWAAASGLRITLIRPDGTVHADSWTLPHLLARLENHGSRPEIEAARQRGIGFASRHSVTTDHPTIYVARMVGPAGVPTGYLRLARESTPPHRPWLAMLLAAALAAGSAWLARLRVQRFQGRVARHLTTWSDLPATSDLEALANDADRHFRVVREELSRELAATRAALAEVSEGVIVLDGQGVVRYANPSAAALVGGELAVGRPLLEAVRSPEVTAAVAAVLGEGGDRHTTCREPRGAELAVRVCAIPHPTLAAAVVLRDLSGERRLERARRALVADLAHELRTPLTVLGGISEELREGGEPAGLVDTLDRQISRLRAFAQDLEELDAIESGRIRLEMRDVEAKAVVSQALDDLRAKAEAAGVTLHSVCEDVRLATDPVRLSQVLTNLVDNGIRYNRPGGRVTVSARQVPEGVRFDVVDDGIGIPADELPLVFQRFYRVRRGRQAEGGSGLGLAIVKHLVHVLGGTVHVSSVEGTGTTVTVVLPSCAPASPPQR